MLERLRKVFYEVMEDESQVLNEDTVISRDLDINSFDFVMLVCELENEFDISISDKEAKTFVTVSDVIKCIESKI